MASGLGSSSAATLAAGPNVVVNGGFETGTFSGWATGGASAAIVTTSHTGSSAARLGVPGAPALTAY